MRKHERGAAAEKTWANSNSSASSSSESSFVHATAVVDHSGMIASQRTGGQASVTPPLWKLLLKDTTFWIIVALFAGILLGWLAPTFSVNMKPLANIFLYMIQALVVPLVFSTLAVGIAEHREDLAAVGRIGAKALLYFEIITTLGFLYGVLAANLVKPGSNTEFSVDEVGSSSDEISSESITWYGELYSIIPQSFFQAAADNSVLQVVFCSIMFAVAVCRVPREKDYEVIMGVLRATSNTMFGVTDLVMNYAPVGVMFSVAYAIGANGFGVLKTLGALVGILYVAYILVFVTVFIPVMLIAKVSIKDYFAYIGPSILLGYSTASSESALPGALEALKAMGISSKVSGFVMPIGYSFNLTGVSVYLALVGLFCAQIAKVDLSVSDQCVMIITFMLTSKGIAAVPRSSLVVLSATLGQFDIPTQTVSFILGADAFMDMGSTALNVAGNCLATIVMARWEGQFPPYGRWEGPYEGKDPRVKEKYEELAENTFVESVRRKSSTFLPANYSVAAYV